MRRGATRSDPVVALLAGVRHNCHVADAHHAAGMTLCTYLLQMRELYRWEQGLALGTPLPREAVGAWMSEREALWERLDREDYQPLPLPPPDGSGSGSSTLADPFDVDRVNAALAPHALLYGAGLVGGVRPVFFVAELHAQGSCEGLRVVQAGHEHARTLLAPPAALGGGSSDGDAGPIVLRRESMARWCWERTEAHGMRPRPGTALHSMLAHYGLDRDFHGALPRWLDDQCDTAVRHELGEHRLGLRWGGRWAELRAEIAEKMQAMQAMHAMHAMQAKRTTHSTPAGAAADDPGRAAGRGEALVRALRDQLADFGVTLPALLARAEAGNPGPLHAWFAGYDGLREACFPALAEGYRAWRDPAAGDGGALLRAQCARGLAHFEALAASLLEGAPPNREAALGRFMAAGEAGVPPPMQVHWPPG